MPAYFRGSKHASELVHNETIQDESKPNSMKKISTLISTGALLLVTGVVSAQWCTPTTAIPYASTMPGITQFTLNTINRPSADLENYPNNSYVNTGLSTNLTPGATYTVTIGYTIDASICPDMNLRVWIDYNQDGSLDDPGETVITANNQTSLTYTGTFTVPMSATMGSTRCRVTAKMTSNGGHSLPTPCDIPADPIGYHGEFEDYTVNIGTTAIEELPTHPVSLFTTTPNPSNGSEITFSFTLNTSAKVRIAIYDVLGNEVDIIRDAEVQPAGDYVIRTSENQLSDGVYFVTITAENAVSTQRLVISRE